LPDELAHEIELAEGSLSEQLFGTRRMRVNSFHHQAVDRPALVLEVTGRSADGVVEALEAKDGRFALALQFHPEGLFVRYPEFLAPFKALIEACSKGE
jgi:putative glutamine amidotransferase